MGSRWVRGSLLGLLAALVLGCGSGGSEQFHVSGRVTFGGQAVPAGTVIFEPDAVKGNNGPQAFARIRDGTFDTARDGRGTLGGPHKVTILGCDGVHISETSPQGKPLFEPFTTTADLPRAAAKLDLEVPTSPARKTSRGN
jgi:hypothetical protein